MEKDKEILNKEDLDNEIDNVESSFNPNDYKVIIELIKTMNDEYNTLVDTVTASLKSNYSLSSMVIDSILPYSNDDINNMTEDDAREFLTKYYDINSSNTINYGEKDRDYCIDVIKDIKNASVVINSSKKELDNLKKDSSDILKEYFNYMSSDKVRKQREQYIEGLETALELEHDESKRAKLQKRIDSLKSALNFTFLKERFDKLGEKEIKNIEDGFFNSKKGMYVIEKYTSKITKFGYKADLYKNFFNIEENFLDEKYSPFNNLFLFISMRVIAYADPYNEKDKLMVSSLISALANLIYHKFDTTEEETMFKGVISSVLDEFYDNVDFYKENNTTYCNHPHRIRQNKIQMDKKKKSIKKSLDLLQTKYPEDASIEELEKILDDRREELVNAQLEEERIETRNRDLKNIILHNNWDKDFKPTDDNDDIEYIFDNDGDILMTYEEFVNKYDAGEYNDLLIEINGKIGSDVSYDENNTLNITPKNSNVTE